jgi:hypothetical protein
MGATTRQRGRHCGDEADSEQKSATPSRSKQEAAEFPHHPVPVWFKSRRMSTNRCPLDTTAAPA